MTKDAVDCGEHFCSSGQKCGSSNSCLAQDAVDCGNGQSCPAGRLCAKGTPWGITCLTREELAERAATEKRQKQELRQWKKETDETEKWLKRQLAEEKKAAEAKRLAQARETARLKEEQRRQELAQKQAAAVITSMQRGTFRPNIRYWGKVLRDQRQSIQTRQLAAAILGKKIPSASGKKVATAQGKQPIIGAASATQQPRPANKATATAPAKCGTTSPCSPTMSSAACMQTEMNDPNECLAARQIAAIALGKDANSVVATPSTVQLTKPSVSGSPVDKATRVMTDQNSKTVAVLSPPPQTPLSGTRTVTASPAAVAIAAAQTSLITGFYSQSSSTSKTAQLRPAPTLWSRVEAAAHATNSTLTNPLVHIGVDTLATAGKAVAPDALGHADDFAKAAIYISHHDYLSLAQQATEKIATTAGGAAGAIITPEDPLLGKAVGSASVKAIIDAGDYYLAPALGSWLFNQNPGLFTPPAADKPN